MQNLLNIKIHIFIKDTDLTHSDSPGTGTQKNVQRCPKFSEL
jgi:hypothetical protein